MSLRVVGGWVRDKLLGKQSADIDVALDTMAGKEFADRVNEYLASAGERTAAVGVIQANPEQSKHLETATMCVHGVWLDFVNLRSESYAEGSRIPEAVSFGTPLEDALRRDLTVNALFYNLHTRTVEDCTGQGLADLRSGVARTPLPPLRTLLDDPLRALRAVRLSTRLRFSLVPELAEAAAAPEALAALGSKVSRERVGVEEEGMLGGPRPLAALALLVRLRMAPVVFALPPQLASSAPPQWPWACLLSLRRTLALLRSPATAPLCPGFPSLWASLDAEGRRWALLAAWCAPLAACVEQPPSSSAKKTSKPVPALHHIIRESLKLRTKDVDNATRLLEAAAAFRALSAAQADSAAPPTRPKLGRLLRSAKGLWRVALCLAAAQSAPGAVALQPDGREGGAGECAAAAERVGALGEDESEEADVGGALPAELAGVWSPFLGLGERAQGLQLDGCWEAKPLLAGGEVQAALGMERPGPALGVWLEALVDWELEHPGGAKEEALAWLRQAAPRPAPAAT